MGSNTLPSPLAATCFPLHCRKTHVVLTQTLTFWRDRLMKRRQFLALAGAAAGHSVAASALQHVRGSSSVFTGAREGADAVLHIRPITLELAPGVSIKTTGYNGHAPGPVLRFKEGAQVNVDVYNETSVAELVHWHGLEIDSLNDGAMEEGSPMISAGGHLRYSFRPKP